ncbi:MAG: glycoside hydrolase [Spirochaetes bacterium]|nr:glycoside hydrolase [Spirochaetota bacterium]
MTRHAPVKTCGTILFIALAVFVQCGAGHDRLLRSPKSKPVAFREVWGYLMRGEEMELKGNEPLTDICYFSARMDRNGKLAGPRDLPGALKSRSVRWHLVVAEISNSLLIGTCINPSLPARENLLKEIIIFSGAYSGVQIDFEAVAPGDRDNFFSFLADLKARLGPGKILSVALPARVRKVTGAYDYAAAAAVADRVIIMAYDQHWSTGEPGPVASLPWCRDVVAYAKSEIPGGKLIMGVPLYGRAWQEVQHSGAIRDTHVREILSRKRPKVEVDPEKGPSMVYTEKVRVRAYFNTLESLTERTRLYSQEEALGVAFWRIGQGDPRLWEYITVAAAANESK